MWRLLDRQPPKHLRCYTITTSNSDLEGWWLKHRCRLPPVAVRGAVMTRVQSQNPTSIMHPPLCPSCGKVMHFVSAVPITPYINLRRAKFECNCGTNKDALVADDE